MLISFWWEFRPPIKHLAPAPPADTLPTRARPTPPPLLGNPPASQRAQILKKINPDWNALVFHDFAWFWCDLPRFHDYLEILISTTDLEKWDHPCQDLDIHQWPWIQAAQSQVCLQTCKNLFATWAMKHAQGMEYMHAYSMQHCVPPQQCQHNDNPATNCMSN